MNNTGNGCDPPGEPTMAPGAFPAFDATISARLWPDLALGVPVCAVGPG